MVSPWESNMLAFTSRRLLSDNAAVRRLDSWLGRLDEHPLSKGGIVFLNRSATRSAPLVSLDGEFYGLSGFPWIHRPKPRANSFPRLPEKLGFA